MSTKAGQLQSLLYHDVFCGASFDYGRIGTSATRYHISLARFRRRLDLIQEMALEPLDLTSLWQCLRGEANSDSGVGGILVSFDDGWRGALTEAAAALEERRWPAFFFVTRGFVGRPFFTDEQRCADCQRRSSPSGRTESLIAC